MTLPKTPKGLQNQITRIRSQLSAEKRMHGALDDSGGLRYYVFYLLFLLQDNRRSSSYLRWYDQTCSDDVGEPLQLLLWALMLNRQGKEGSENKLCQAMLSNVYTIPAILGQDIDELDLRFHSNYESRNYLKWFPERILDAISNEDKAWMKETYDSVKFRGILDRYLAIAEQLELLPRGEERPALVEEQWRLSHEFR